jgi:peptidyl-prolyl cis-trans isomerase C
MVSTMISTQSLPRVFAVALSAMLFASAPVSALEPTDVIAESSRARLTVADYEAELAKLPAATRAEFAASALRLKQYLDNLYISSVLAADARAEGLDRDPVLARQIATQVNKMLAQAQVERIEMAAAAEFDRSPDRFTARARELYLVNRAKYGVPEKVRAAHILVMIKDSNKDAALARATDIRAKAVAGADFAKLAREFSDDPTVARNGGELGFFEAKSMETPFAAAAFAMTRKGEISAPVLTKYGYHIILFEDRQPARVRTFEEVMPEIMAEQKTKFVADARDEATRRIFTDPTLKVDVDLINRINAEAAARTPSAPPVPAKP